MGMMVLCVHSATLEEKIDGKSIEELSKMLAERFDDSEIVNTVMWRFRVLDGFNYASYGNQEALDWARKVVRSEDSRFNTYPAREYLMRKGDERDFGTIGYGFGTVLAKRVEGTNVVNYHPFLNPIEPHWFGCIPSVTNTGPQGLYVEKILHQYWDNMETETEGSYSFKDESKIPPELITMVVWFDDDGNPVCNVDLAKYGLTMPEIDLPQDVRDEILRRVKGRAQASSPSRETDPPKKRLWLYLGILAVLVSVLVIACKKRR